MVYIEEEEDGVVAEAVPRLRAMLAVLAEAESLALSVAVVAAGKAKAGGRTCVGKGGTREAMEAVVRMGKPAGWDDAGIDAERGYDSPSDVSPGEVGESAGGRRTAGGESKEPAVLFVDGMLAIRPHAPSRGGGES